MNTTHSVKFHLVIAGLGLALLLADCATTPKGERYVVAPLGTTFTSSSTSTGSYGSGTTETITKITERMWEGKKVTAFVSSSGVLLASSEGWMAILAPDDKPIFTWDPPIGYDWPLEVGKTSTKSYRITIHPRNQTIPFDNTNKIEAYEDVTVPAGTFKVFKISSSDTLGNENIAWFSPELGFFIKQTQKRTDKNPSGPGTRETEVIKLDIAK
jgi:hypothetical protein